jgi:hypothetical protein
MKMSTFRWAKRGEKTPMGYTVKYVYRDSDYVTHRSKAFVKKKKKPVNHYRHKSLRGRIDK